MDVEKAQAVLIVAKCIVNPVEFITCISSSFVLIVAKCIVNKTNNFDNPVVVFVLIVAKCIVNINFLRLKIPKN